MTNKRKCEIVCRELGVELTVNYGVREVIADAPGDRVFVSTGTHSVVCCDIDAEGPFEAIWSAILADVADGLEECRQTDCDICREHREEQS